jgi:Fic family protein
MSVKTDKNPVKARQKPDKDFSVETYSKKYKISERSAQRKIQELLNLNEIILSKKIGQKNYYKKVINNDEQVNKFSKYQKSFLDNYIPNKTNLINKAESAKLLKMITPEHQVDLETYSLRIYERLIIDLSWASSALEGNTYSLLETEKLILENEIASGKNNLETQMILNHKEAIKFLILNKKELNPNPFVIKSIHALLSENIIRNKSAQGAVRKIPVGITGTSYIPLAIPQLLEEEFDIFLKKASQIINPIEQSFFILIFISYIQFFEDLNKRTSRISCNIPFIKNNLIPISFKDIDKDNYVMALKNIYEANNVTKLKTLFINSLKKSADDYSRIISTLITPSDIQIKYRVQIKSFVRDCVLGKLTIGKLDLTQFSRKESPQILEEIQNELKNLHEGSLIRFGLKSSEFERWKKNNKSAER